MKKLDYRWTQNPKRQFVDGHERDDVVAYCQGVFLLPWTKVKVRTCDWSREGQPDPPPSEQHTVVWFHDKSTFYANDCRLTQWVHKDETPVPYAKGKGPSQMVADLVSTDYGWLQSPDGKEEARVLFKAGKNHEGYFTSDDILEQANKAMLITPPHTLNELMVLSQHGICLNSHQKWKTIGASRSMCGMKIGSQYMVPTERS